MERRVALLVLRRSGQADPPDRQCEGAGLALGDHEADLAEAGGVEGWCAGDLAAAEAGAELGQRDAQALPAIRVGCEGGLVVQAVEGVLGQEVELEAPGVAARTSAMQDCALPFQRSARAERTDANPPFRSSETFPSNTAWPAGSWRRRLLETPPITRSSIGTHASTSAALAKSKSVHGASESPMSSFWGVSGVAWWMARSTQQEGRR